MSRLTVTILVPLLLALAAGAGVWAWFAAAPEPDAELRLPSPPLRVHYPAGLPGELERAQAEPADLPGSWPGFRGPNRDGVSPDPAPLAETWPAGGPEVLWSVRVGEGYGGAAVLNGCVYLLDYDEVARRDVLRCLSLASGREIWRYAYALEIPSDHGFSRTVPAVTDGYCVSLSPACHVLCVRTDTGEYLWHKDLVEQYDGEVPGWYTGQCPLIDVISGKPAAVVAPGGKSMIAAFDCETGEPIWESPAVTRPDAEGKPIAWQATHSSVMPVTFRGAKRTWEMYVYAATDGVVAVAKDDGRILWTFDEWQVVPANVPSPVLLGDGRLLLSGGYGAGSILLELREVGDGLRVEEVRRMTSREFGSYQQTPVFYPSGGDGHVYGVMPKDAGNLREQLVCLSPEGSLRWASGRDDRFGWGPFAVADGKVFVMDDSGLLTLARATPEGYRRLARAQVLPAGKESWAPLAIAGRRLICRDFTRMICLDVGR